MRARWKASRRRFVHRHWKRASWRRRGKRRLTGAPTGGRGNWGDCWASVITSSPSSGSAGYQPHRFERYMASDDPDFERKAADVIGCTSIRRNTRRCLRLMRKRTSKRSSAGPRVAALAGTSRAPWLCMTGTGRCRCCERSIYAVRGSAHADRAAPHERGLR